MEVIWYSTTNANHWPAPRAPLGLRKSGLVPPGALDIATLPWTLLLRHHSHRLWRVRELLMLLAQTNSRGTAPAAVPPCRQKDYPVLTFLCVRKPLLCALRWPSRPPPPAFSPRLPFGPRFLIFNLLQYTTTPRPQLDGLA